MFFIPFISFFASLQALTVLPPKTSLGGEIGRSFGEGFSRGVDRAFEQQYQRRLEELQNQQEFSKLLQLLHSQKEEVEKEWLKDYFSDVAKLGVVERINKISPIANSSSFVNEHPAIQCVIAQLVLHGHLYPEMSNLLSKCLQNKQIGNADFAVELLTEAANKKNYTQAKKILASHYEDKKSYSQILYWLHSAAEDGSGDAMRALASYYLRGEGVFIDFTESIKWLALAAAKGEKQSSQVLQFMIKSKQISQANEYKEGLERARKWKQEHISLFIHP